jgi:hypothetical protein
MNIADHPIWTIRTGPKVIRIALVANFLILIALVGLGQSRELDHALRRAGVEDLIGRSLQVWIVGSTILSTVLFASILWKKKKMATSVPGPELKFEGALLMIWWIVLVGLLAYGFMLGMGG